MEALLAVGKHCKTYWSTHTLTSHSLGLVLHICESESILVHCIKRLIIVALGDHQASVIGLLLLEVAAS